MDKDTLESLLKEAESNADQASERFVIDDNPDDMHEADSWVMVIGWLRMKLRSCK